MSVSEREAILREREAFFSGGNSEASALRGRGRVEWPIDEVFADLRKRAAKAYPLPKVTRHRIIADPVYTEVRWTMRRGEMANYDSDIVPQVYPSRERIRIWNELLINPTEEVDATE